MANMKLITMRKLKKIFNIFASAVFVLTLGVASAFASDGVSLNIYPAVGKPIYGVAELAASLPEPVSVQIASQNDYQRAGYTRPSFFDAVDIKKMSNKRYLIKTQAAVNTPVFVMMLDVEFQDMRRLYPVSIEINAGQVTANFESVIEYPQVIDQPVSISPAPAVAAIAPIQNDMTRILENSSRAITSSEMPAPAAVEVVSSAPVRQPTVTFAGQNVEQPRALTSQPQVSYSSMAPQQPIFYPAMSSNASSSGNAADQFPFYLVIIVLTVLILVAMFVVVMFMHKNHDSRHHVANTEHHTLMSELLKTLPSLMGGHARQQPTNHLAASTAAQMAHDPWYQEQPQIHAMPPAMPVPEKPQPMQPVVQANEVAKPQSQPQPQPGKQTKPVSQPQSVVPPQPVRKPEVPPQQRPMVKKPSAPQVGQSPVAASKPMPAMKAEPSAQAISKKPSPKGQEKSEKLQLAIVYMNMGDEVMARMLLEEISRDGSELEKAEASAILNKLNNLSDRPIVAESDQNAE